MVITDGLPRGKWTALFVTADVPIETLNEVLKAGTDEIYLPVQGQRRPVGSVTDGTVSFWLRDVVSPTEVAEMNVAWGISGPLDVAMVHWVEGDRHRRDLTHRRVTDEDVLVMAKAIQPDAPQYEGGKVDGVPLAELRKRVLDWMNDEADCPLTRWFEFRLKVATANQCMEEIWGRGSVILKSRSRFEQDGHHVMGARVVPPRRM